MYLMISEHGVLERCEFLIEREAVTELEASSQLERLLSASGAGAGRQYDKTVIAALIPSQRAKE